jgi:hypothetical protein
MGIALMMERVFDHYKHPDVVGIPLTEVIDSHIVLAHPKDCKLTGSAQAFVEAIAKARVSAECAV